MSNESIDERTVAAEDGCEILACFGVTLEQRQQLLIAVVRQGLNQRVVRLRESGNLHGDNQEKS